MNFLMTLSYMCVITLGHTQTLLTFCVSIHHSNWISFFPHVSLLPDNVLRVI